MTTTLPTVQDQEPEINFDGTPYEILGVAPNATDEDIKKAYRRLAMRFHPDRTGGDADLAEQFKKVKEAYDFLSDKESRAFYDATGQKPVSDEDVEKRAYKVMYERMLAILDGMCGPNSPVPEQQLGFVCPVTSAKKALQEELQNLHRTITNMKGGLRRYTKVFKKLSHKSGNFAETFVGIEIQGRIDKLTRNIALAKVDIRILGKAIKLTDEFDYEEDPPPQWQTSTTFFDNGGDWK